MYAYISTIHNAVRSHYIDAIAMGPDGFSVANENQIMKGSARELKW